MNNKKYEMTLYGKKQSDCDVIMNDVENVFGSIGTCVNNALDEKKTKMQVAGSFFGILGATTKLLFHGTTCAVKNTPKAIATVANAKRKLVDGISEEYSSYQKEQKEQALEEKIKRLLVTRKELSK